MSLGHSASRWRSARKCSHLLQLLPDLSGLNNKSQVVIRHFYFHKVHLIFYFFFGWQQSSPAKTTWSKLLTSFRRFAVQYFRGKYRCYQYRRLSRTFPVASLSYSYSVWSVSSSVVSGAVCQGTPGGRFPLLVVIWMSWSTYSANQQSRFETRVQLDSSRWSRFRQTEKGFDVLYIFKCDGLCSKWRISFFFYIFIFSSV